MDTAKLLDLFNEQTNAANVLWGFFSTVALAVLGFAYKDGKPIGSNQLRWALTGGFLLFALSNGAAMWRASTTLHSLSKVIQRKAAEHQDVAEVLRTYDAPDPSHILIAQVVFGLVVLGLIWLPVCVTFREPSAEHPPQPD